MVEVVADPTKFQLFVSRDSAWTRTAALLDAPRQDLQASGAAFPFPLTSGFAEFNTPTRFVQLNRAIKARVDAYRKNWSDALTDLNGSFIDTSSGSAASHARGVYHVFSTASGDQTNPLFDPSAVAVPSFLADA